MPQKREKNQSKGKASETKTPLLLPTKVINREEPEDEEELGESWLPVVVQQAIAEEIQKKIESGELLSYVKGKKIVTFDPREEGMRISWRKFVDEYFKNGFNGTRAYMAVFPDVKENTAATEASLLLRNPKVVSLIRRKLDAEDVDDEWVIANLKEKASFNDSFRIQAATAAVLGIAKIRGLLNDNKRQPFDSSNPAVFLPVYTAEERAKFDEQRQKMGRITE